MHPQVTLHFAQSLDGRIGFGSGKKRVYLSSPEGTASAHRARGCHDAVLIGVETALGDDPLLTARCACETQPLRVVLDSALRLPASARLLASAAPAGDVVVFGVAERADTRRRELLQRAGAEVQLIRGDSQGLVALPDVLDALHGRGVERLLVEGGARVLTAFLRAELAGRVEIEVAPVWLGAPGLPAIGELGEGGVDGALRLDGVEIERLGASLLLSGEIVYGARHPS